MLDVARELNQAGFCTIPIRLDGTKAPTQLWGQFEKRLPNDSELSVMFARGRVGLGIVGGKVSGNYETMDFDLPGIFDLWLERLAEHDVALAARILEDFPLIATPNGGRHLGYRCEEPVETCKLAMSEKPWVDKQGKEHRTLIETKSEGGYVVAPPSPPECHEAGIPYEHVSGPPLTTPPTISVEQRSLMLEVAMSFNEVVDDTEPKRKPKSKPTTTGTTTDIKPGADFERRASWESILTPHGWKLVKQLTDNSRWRRPSKTGKGHSATTGGKGNWFFTFSSNAQPFEYRQYYSKFAAYTLLNHKGDYTAAAKALSKDGYGSPPKKQKQTKSDKPVDIDEFISRLAKDPNTVAFEAATLALAAKLYDDDPGAYERLVGELKNKVRITSWERAVKAHPKPQTAPQQPPQQQPPDPRPRIKLTVELHEVVDEAVDALTDDPGLYQRDNGLVHVVRTTKVHSHEDTDTPQDKRGFAIGTPIIRPVVVAQLRERLTRVARFVKWDGRIQGFKPMLPTEPVTAAVHARGQWKGMRPLVGIIEAPSMRPDGTLIQEAGYDQRTGYLYLPNIKYLPVPDRPTQADANEALRQLTKVWCDFPFSCEAARYVPVAAVLSLLARPAIAGPVPGVVIDASTRGSGKTLCTDAITKIANGRGANRMSWPAKEEELEKVLASYALRGASVICFDNIAHKFGGGPLDRVLTAEDMVELRVLGKSEVPALEWRALVMGSGNNVPLCPDTTRRVMVCRIETEMENPEDRPPSVFTNPQLLKWITANRPRLVQAALTVLRAHVVGGSGAADVKPWGSFEAWSSVVAGAIVHAGGEDVTQTRASSGEKDPESGALQGILENWERLAPEGATAKVAINSLYTREWLKGECAPDGFEDLREAIETAVPTQPGRAPSSRLFAYKLRSWRGRVVSGKRIVGVVSHGGPMRWVVQCV
ncbi:MAG: bifunctional DNA primase/polymerase [Candidatus Omnitrophica bacterium]|nr:bifunctional DNA primase/polymerase [Candidatus Omnitrophota bacterium]